MPTARQFHEFLFTIGKIFPGYADTRIASLIERRRAEQRVVGEDVGTSGTEQICIPKEVGEANCFLLRLCH